MANENAELMREIREISTFLTNAVLLNKPKHITTFCAEKLEDKLQRRNAKPPLPVNKPLRRHESIIKATEGAEFNLASVGVTTGMQQFDPLKSQVLLSATGSSGSNEMGDINGNAELSDVTVKPGVTLEGHTAAVTQCHVTPTCVITSSLDSTLIIWDLNNGSCLLSLACHGPVKDFACCQLDTRRLLILAAGDDGRVSVWRVRFSARKLRAKLVTTLTCNLPNPIAAISISPDARRFATGCCFLMNQITLARTCELRMRGTLKTWDLQALTALVVKRAQQTDDATKSKFFDFTYVSLRTMHQLIATSTHQRNTKYNKLSGEQIREEHSYGIRAIAYTPDSQQLVVGFGHAHDIGQRGEKMLVVCCASSLTTLWVDTGQSYQVNGVQVSCKGRGTAAAPWQLFVFTQFGVRKLVAHNKDSQPVRANVQVVWSHDFESAHYGGAVSSDGRLVASAVGNDIVIWDALTGYKLAVLVGHSATATRMAFSQENAFLCTVSRDNTARLWRITTHGKRTKRAPSTVESTYLEKDRSNSVASVDSTNEDVVSTSPVVRRNSNMKKRYSVRIPSDAALLKRNSVPQTTKPDGVTPTSSTTSVNSEQ